MYCEYIFCLSIEGFPIEITDICFTLELFLFVILSRFATDYAKTVIDQASAADVKAATGLVAKVLPQK